MIGILDYGSGNVQAIANIYTRLNISHCLISRPVDLNDGVQKLILPGVGAFDETMHLLLRSGLRESLEHQVIQLSKPILGICVGMQIMANSSEEGVAEGLGWIPGKVRLLDSSKIQHKPKLPHLGWNTVALAKSSPLLEGIDFQEGFYFIHSYYYECERSEDVMTITQYGVEFASSVNRLNVFGTQFHPEKSHENGVRLLRNFADLV